MAKLNVQYNRQIDPWWCHQLPNDLGLSRTTERHVEDEYKLWQVWDETKFGDVEMSDDMEYATINGFENNIDLPQYIKIVIDSVNTLYFYQDKPTRLQNISSKNYLILYKQDQWMTKFLKMHKIALEEKIDTKFLMSFSNELDLIQDGKDAIVNYNLWLQQWLSMYADEPLGTIKEEIWYTNAKELRSINDLTDAYTKYDALTKNNTYMYVLCNSSALISVYKDKNNYPISVNQGTNKILIIPILNAEMIKAMQRIDVGYSIDVSKWEPSDFSNINPLGPAFMKAYTSLLPPSVIIAQALKQYTDTNDAELLVGKKIRYRSKDGDPTDPSNYSDMLIDCLAIDATLSIDLILRHFETQTLEQNKDGIGTRLFNFLETFDSYRDEHNSIMAAHPQYFYECIKFDDQYQIEYSYAHLQLRQKYEDILESFDINIRVCWSEGENYIYSFGNNTNESNIDMNFTNSNLRFKNPWFISILGSSAANLFAEGPTSALMGVSQINATNKNIRENEAMDITSRSSTYAKNIVNFATDMANISTFDAVFSPQKVAAKKIRGIANIADETIQYGVDIARTAINANFQVNNNNRQLAATMSNNLSKPSGAVSDSYIGSYSKIPLDENGNPKLFRTFCYKLPPWDFRRKFEETWEYGMKQKRIYYKEEGGYRAYQNRELFNIVKIQSSYNTAEWIDTIKKNLPPSWIYNNRTYIINFLTLLSMGLIIERQIYQTPRKHWRYNIESIIPSILGPKISLRFITNKIWNSDLQIPPTIDEVQQWVEENNTPPPSITWETIWKNCDLVYEPKKPQSTLLITVKQNSEILRGSVIIYVYTSKILMNKWIVYNRDTNTQLASGDFSNANTIDIPTPTDQMNLDFYYEYNESTIPQTITFLFTQNSIQNNIYIYPNINNDLPSGDYIIFRLGQVGRGLINRILLDRIEKFEIIGTGLYRGQTQSQFFCKLPFDLSSTLSSQMHDITDEALLLNAMFLGFYKPDHKYDTPEIKAILNKQYTKKELQKAELYKCQKDLLKNVIKNAKKYNNKKKNKHEKK